MSPATPEPDDDGVSTRLDAVEKSPTKPSRLMVRIRQGIMDGVHPLDTPLREEALEAAYGSTRGAVREALRILQSRGLATHEERRGFRVRGYTSKSVTDLYMLRGNMERMAVEQLSNVAPEQIRSLVVELNISNERMAEALKTGQTADYLQENITFHSLIVQASDNEPLERTLMLLNETAEPLRHALLRKKGARATSHIDHQRITDLIAAGNLAAAAAATEFHILQNFPGVLEVLKEISESGKT